MRYTARVLLMLPDFVILDDAGQKSETRLAGKRAETNF